MIYLITLNKLGIVIAIQEFESPKHAVLVCRFKLKVGQTVLLDSANDYTAFCNKYPKIQVGLIYDV